MATRFPSLGVVNLPSFRLEEADGPPPTVDLFPWDLRGQSLQSERARQAAIVTSKTALAQREHQSDHCDYASLFNGVLTTLTRTCLALQDSFKRATFFV